MKISKETVWGGVKKTLKFLLCFLSVGFLVGLLFVPVVTLCGIVAFITCPLFWALWIWYGIQMPRKKGLPFGFILLNLCVPAIIYLYSLFPEPIPLGQAPYPGYGDVWFTTSMLSGVGVLFLGWIYGSLALYKQC